MWRAIALCAFSASAVLADPVRTEPAEHITVFADGSKTVTLVGVPKGKLAAPLNRVMNVRANGGVRARNVGNAIFGLGQKTWWVRVRSIDGALVCEKFGIRPKDPEDVAPRAAELFAESCS
jgi:hypothetical protein